MASVLIASTDFDHPFLPSSKAIALAGSRLWVTFNSGTLTPSGASGPGSQLYYSDDNGANWTYHSTPDSSASRHPHLRTYQQGGSWRLVHLTSASGKSAT